MSHDKGCGCGDHCDHDHGEENYITLEFDDGVSVECEILGIFEVGGKEYIALFPDDGSDDVYLYGYKEANEEEFEIIDIEDDLEFKKVAEVFEKIAMSEVTDLEN